jgi:hypothetical protein
MDVSAATYECIPCVCACMHREQCLYVHACMLVCTMCKKLACVLSVVLVLGRTFSGDM